MHAWQTGAYEGSLPATQFCCEPKLVAEPWSSVCKALSLTPTTASSKIICLEKNKSMMCMLVLGLPAARSSCTHSAGSMTLQRLGPPQWDKLRLVLASSPSRAALWCHLKPSSAVGVVLGLEGGRHWVLEVMAGRSVRAMPGEGLTDPPVRRGEGCCALWAPTPQDSVCWRRGQGRG